MVAVGGRKVSVDVHVAVPWFRNFPVFLILKNVAARGGTGAQFEM